VPATRLGQGLFADLGAERHIVQLYREEGAMGAVVGAWLSGALAGGGGALLIGTPEHAAGVRDVMARGGVDVTRAEDEGRLLVLDARETLARFMRSPDEPGRDLFLPLARAAVARVRGARGGRGAEVRAWGEMVDILWHEGKREAAARLESLWNEAIDEGSFRLLCSYRIDNLDERAHVGGDVLAACVGHSCLIPEADAEAFDAAVGAALVDVFGEAEAGLVRAAFARRRAVPAHMPTAELVLLALQRERPDSWRRVLAAARARMLTPSGTAT
jgi:hypothetical protein